MLFLLLACGEKETLETADTVGDCVVLEDVVCGQAAVQQGGDTACPDGFACWGPSAFQCYQGDDCNLPICLSELTTLATPEGPVVITELVAGDLILTAEGVEPIQRISSVQAPAHHQLVALLLDDGRALQASPGHPTTDGRSLGELAVGDDLDGARIVALWRNPYTGRTWDVLPATYQANGIWLASTLVHQDGVARVSP
jgi:hypothetical protein